MDLLYLNQLAQGVHSLDDAVALIDEHGDNAGRDALWRLSLMADQAGATTNDVPAAIANAGLDSNYSPSWLPSDGPFRATIDPNNVAPGQIVTEFRYLIAIYSIADNRRRADCGAPNCHHWWHQDLGDPEALHEVQEHLKRYGA